MQYFVERPFILKAFCRRFCQFLVQKESNQTKQAENPRIAARSNETCPKKQLNPTSGITLRWGGLVLNGYPPCLIFCVMSSHRTISCMRCDRFSCPGLSNYEMFLLLCSLTTWGKIVMPKSSSFFFFQIDKFSLCPTTVATIYCTGSPTTMLMKWGSNLSFSSCTIWRLNFCIWRPWFL